MKLDQVKRLRWAVRAVLTLGVAASVAANILHALHNPISQAIAAWPPLALLLTVELISRIPVHRRGLGFARMFAAAAIAGIAAWVSYWHMAGVAARYGEQGSAPFLLPFSVDGLIVVASICLVELSDRYRSLADQQPAPSTRPAPHGSTDRPSAPASSVPSARPSTPAVPGGPDRPSVPTTSAPPSTGAQIPAARPSTPAPAAVQLGPPEQQPSPAAARHRVDAGRPRTVHDAVRAAVREGLRSRDAVAKYVRDTGHSIANRDVRRLIDEVLADCQ